MDILDSIYIGIKNWFKNQKELSNIRAKACHEERKKLAELEGKEKAHRFNRL